MAGTQKHTGKKGTHKSEIKNNETTDTSQDVLEVTEENGAKYSVVKQSRRGRDKVPLTEEHSGRRKSYSKRQGSSLYMAPHRRHGAGSKKEEEQRSKVTSGTNSAQDKKSYSIAVNKGPNPVQNTGAKPNPRTTPQKKNPPLPTEDEKTALYWKIFVKENETYPDLDAVASDICDAHQAEQEKSAESPIPVRCPKRSLYFTKYHHKNYTEHRVDEVYFAGEESSVQARLKEVSPNRLELFGSINRPHDQNNLYKFLLDISPLKEKKIYKMFLPDKIVDFLKILALSAKRIPEDAVHANMLFILHYLIYLRNQILYQDRKINPKPPYKYPEFVNLLDVVITSAIYEYENNYTKNGNCIMCARKTLINISYLASQAIFCDQMSYAISSCPYQKKVVQCKEYLPEELLKLNLTNLNSVLEEFKKIIILRNQLNGRSDLNTGKNTELYHVGNMIRQITELIIKFNMTTDEVVKDLESFIKSAITILNYDTKDKETTIKIKSPIRIADGTVDEIEQIRCVFFKEQFVKNNFVSIVFIFQFLKDVFKKMDLEDVFEGVIHAKMGLDFMIPNASKQTSPFSPLGFSVSSIVLCEVVITSTLPKIYSKNGKNITNINLTTGKKPPPKNIARYYIEIKGKVPCSTMINIYDLIKFCRKIFPSIDKQGTSTPYHTANELTILNLFSPQSPTATCSKVSLSNPVVTQVDCCIVKSPICPDTKNSEKMEKNKPTLPLIKPKNIQYVPLVMPVTFCSGKFDGSPNNANPKKGDELYIQFGDPDSSPSLSFCSEEDEEYVVHLSSLDSTSSTYESPTTSLTNVEHSGSSMVICGDDSDIPKIAPLSITAGQQDSSLNLESSTNKTEQEKHCKPDTTLSTPVVPEDHTKKTNGKTSCKEEIQRPLEEQQLLYRNLSSYSASEKAAYLRNIIKLLENSFNEESKKRFNEFSGSEGGKQILTNISNLKSEFDEENFQTRQQRVNF